MITVSLAASRMLQRSDDFVLSGVLRQQAENRTTISLSTSNIEALIKSALIPKDPIEAIDRILLQVFKGTDSADKPFQFVFENDYPIAYARNEREFQYYVDQAASLNYLEQKWNKGWVRLTIDGWKRVSQLRDARPLMGKKAFIAMQYGDATHTQIYNENFKRAVAKTGFDLIRLDQVLKAGLIDNQLRVHIRDSRFLLADLTNRNPGAYWEAGYAEGLGIPVIYLCKKSEFNALQTHFDTNHHTTIRWDENDMAQSMDELKATIRATFPGEARLTDD